MTNPQQQNQNQKNAPSYQDKNQPETRDNKNASQARPDRDQDDQNKKFGKEEDKTGDKNWKAGSQH